MRFVADLPVAVPAAGHASGFCLTVWYCRCDCSTQDLPASMQAGQIELSAELTAAEEVQHKTSSNGCSCTAASAEKALEQRQQSGSSCSTSMSDTDIQHNKKLKRTSSVKSRAAYFEAMTQSSPEQTSCPSPPRQGTPQRRPLKMVSICKLLFISVAEHSLNRTLMEYT